MPNELIIKELTKLTEQMKHDLIKKSPDAKTKMVNGIRLKKIQELIEIVKKYPQQIKSGKQIEHLKGVGKGSVRRIDEILEHGKLSEIKIDRGDKQLLAQIKDLSKVYGIGESIAVHLIKQYKITSVAELKKAYKKKLVPLNDHILLGLKYYKVYQRKIPREEIALVDKYLEKATKSVDKNLTYVICGSYRRQRNESKDIDVLLVHPKAITKDDLVNGPNYLKLLIDKLKQDKFIVEDIDKNFNVKYMGFCRLNNNPIRHIDIMYVPYESYWTAVLHFTGSGEFNEKMRHHAKLLGYKLNQYGLFKVDKANKKLTTVQVNSEKDIFDALGMDYVLPQNRQIS